MKKMQGSTDGIQLAMGEWGMAAYGKERDWVKVVCEVGGRMLQHVLVPPPLFSPQPISGSLPSLPADFSLGGSEKNCPLSLLPTAKARALACPPDINQHTLSLF